MITVILGSCGGLTGVFLAKHFRKIFPKVVLVGFDISEDIYTKYLLDEFYKSPPSGNEEAFLEFLRNLSQRLGNKPLVYCPTHSAEFFVVVKHINEIRKMGFSIEIHSYRTYKVFNDKYRAYYSLRNLGIPVPKFSESFSSEIVPPVFAKPKISSGSKGIVVLRTEEEYRAFANSHDNYVFMEFLQGQEYTIDIFFKSGKVLGLVPRKRLKTIGGAAVITESDFTVEGLVRDYIEVIGKTYHLHGPANFQFFYTDQGVVFTDFNLRFPSGGLPLSTYLGLDLGKMFVELSLGKNISINMVKKKVRMYRYFEEFFTEIYET